MNDTTSRRQQLVAALEREIARGLEKGELNLPAKRLGDIGWLARNAAIENQNLRGKAVQLIAHTIWWGIDLAA